jgi:hypothetical protein
MSDRLAGFGLLEAIVSLALLTGAGVVILSWLQSSLLQLERSKEREARARMTANADALITGINLADRPSGKEVFAGLQVEWLTEPIERNGSNVTAATEGSPTWTVELVRVKVVARATQGPFPASIKFEVLRALPRQAAATIPASKP